jgi:trk system potassium uptake protein TrkH
MALVLSGFVIFLVLEYNNTLSELGFFEKITAALFLSVSPRTAGFNTVSVGDLTESSKLISSVLMLVGGSPGSTAGGMKTTTLAVMLISAVAAVRGADETVVFKRRLEKDIIHQAVAIFTVYISVVIFSTVIISTYEGLPLIDVLFETASAAGTVGMTTGITQRLKIFSKIILMVLMFSGRIGILTFAMAVGKKRKKSHISRPTDKLMIG